MEISEENKRYVVARALTRERGLRKPINLWLNKSKIKFNGATVSDDHNAYPIATAAPSMKDLTTFETVGSPLRKILRINKGRAHASFGNLKAREILARKAAVTKVMREFDSTKPVAPIGKRPKKSNDFEKGEREVKSAQAELSENGKSISSMLPDEFKATKAADTLKTHSIGKQKVNKPFETESGLFTLTIDVPKPNVEHRPFKAILPGDPDYNGATPLNVDLKRPRKPKQQFDPVNGAL